MDFDMPLKLRKRQEKAAKKRQRTDTVLSDLETEEFETITDCFLKRKGPMQINESYLRNTNAKRQEEAPKSNTSASTAIITPKEQQNVDIGPVDHGARRLSWSRIIDSNKL